MNAGYGTARPCCDCPAVASAAAPHRHRGADRLCYRASRSAACFDRLAGPRIRLRCLVLDIRLPGRSGLDFQAELANAEIDIPIILMTGHGDIPMSVRAMKAGAIDFLTKPFRDQDMLDAVMMGLERDRKRRNDEKMVAALRALFDSLTPRERQVMTYVTEGLMNKQIAAEIGICEVTVKIHRGSVMKKMGAKSLADLVRMADMLGIRRAKAWQIQT